MLPSLPNLVANACTRSVPWEFVPSTPIPENVRGKDGKKLRTDWLNDPSTRHDCFFGWEAVSSVQRVKTKDDGEGASGPHTLIAITADFDTPWPTDDFASGFDRMEEFVPNYLGKSLSGNVHAIWLLEKPLSVSFAPLAVELMKHILKVSPVAKLHPGLDKGHFCDPAKALTNGCDWKEITKTRLSSDTVRGWFFETVKKHNFAKHASVGPAIPLEDLIEPLAARYPHFKTAWPGEFVLGSRGPTFWEPESTSPLSAYVTENGIFSFADHAAHRRFSTWADLLGHAFVRNYETKRIGAATESIYFDNKDYFVLNSEGVWVPYTRTNIALLLKVERGLSSIPKKGAPSEVEEALNHIHTLQRIDFAGPCVYRKPGVLTVDHKLLLNVFRGRVLPAAEGPQQWGGAGNFPWLSNFIGNFFSDKEQLDYFLAWLKRFYSSAARLEVQSGQAVFLVGATSKGKTFMNTRVIGGLMGSHTDAREYLTSNSGGFGSQMFYSGVWGVDDGVISGAKTAHARFSEMVKAIAANVRFECHEKFRVPAMVEWQGRLVVTANPDAESLRILPTLDINILDKVMLFRMNDDAQPNFKSNDENHATLDRELPNFARWLLDWTPPETVLSPNPRYGVKSYHHPELLLSARLSSDTGAFRELIEDWATTFFSGNSASTWSGSTRALASAVASFDDRSTRNYRGPEFSRKLQMIENDSSMTHQVTCEIRAGKDRLWTIHRPAGGRKPASHIPPQAENSAFAKNVS